MDGVPSMVFVSERIARNVRSLGVTLEEAAAAFRGAGVNAERLSAKLADLNSIPVETVPDFTRPKVKQSRLVSACGFTEYDPEDADWAVPAGLARWETVEVECDVVYLIDPGMFQIGAGFDPSFGVKSIMRNPAPWELP
jgi:hypothetical protein